MALTLYVARGTKATLDIDHNRETEVYEYEDVSAEYHPCWLSAPRGFQDLRAIEAERFNGLLAEHLPSDVKGWTCEHDGWTFALEDVVVNVQQDRVSPLAIVAASDTMPRKVLDPLRSALRRVPLRSDGMFWNATAFAIGLLQVVEEAVSWQRDWHLSVRPATTSDVSGWHSQSGPSRSALLSNTHGLDLTTVEDTAAHLLGEPIAAIYARVAHDYRVLHVEPVFRPDLVSRYRKAQARILEDLLTMPRGKLRQSVSADAIRPGAADDTVAGLAAHLAQPSVTFHGAPRHVMHSIVRYGFILPGKAIGHATDAPTLAVRCGSTYGRGVYSSPDPVFASSYTQYHNGTLVAEPRNPSDVPGLRILVCATLMGAPLRVDRENAWGVEAPLRDDAHAHVSPSGLEYIVFDAAQILPCYVLYLDYRAERTNRKFERLLADPGKFFSRRRKAQSSKVNKWAETAEERESPGDAQRRKEALKAAAAKWFPYGYGPASGTSFVIGEVAEVSDDEEVYGDFQHERVEQEDEVREQRVAAGGSWFDDYQTVRKTKREVDVGSSWEGVKWELRNWWHTGKGRFSNGKS